MDKKLYVLPALCLGGATLLLAPARQSQAFSKLGGSLSETQRDVRLFDNFLDPTANDNVTPASQFPGYVGAELAIWKGIVEWGSMLHGDGTGDPLSGNQLGSGGANFDAMWAGNASAAGTTNNNIVSAVTSCGGGGTLAFTETPISDGWRIKFCDEWTWDDGPGTIGSRWDIQGIMVHEYGHALGLGHSGSSTATMFPSAGPGAGSLRSIATDDINGIQCVYGVASATKPTIVATAANPGPGTISIYGTDFGATDNEVWFTNGAITNPSVEPIVKVTGASSVGNVITVSIPAGAGPGDVMINKSGAGGATLSNAFPTDLVGTFGTPPGGHPDITSITPSTIDALIPGTDQTITLSGTNLHLTTSVLLDAAEIPASRYTIVNSNTITLDMPQAPTLGSHTLSVSDVSTSDGLPVTIVAPATPKYELGTGDPFNIIDVDDGLSFILSGTVGSVQRAYASNTPVPSSIPAVTLDIGNQFSNLYYGGQFVIPAAGWLQVNIPSSAMNDPGDPGTILYGQNFAVVFPTPFPVSNLQSIFLVR